jgi:intracellular sulfur oxidation DsrE/DsrF family protein
LPIANKDTMEETLKKLFLFSLFGMFLSAWAAMASAASEIKTVYHLNEGIEQAVAALRNARNHLDADPGAKIVFVTHGKGIDFLLDGAKDKNGNPFEVTVQTLKQSRVEFRVCRNTLTSRKIDPATVIVDATIVPSGVAEVARLQANEGFVYLRP